jgi:high-affinity iron transporter
MAAQAIHLLQAAGVVTALSNRVWDTSWLLSDSSILGRLLHVLVGYTAKPTAMQLVVYLLTLAAILVLMRFSSASRRHAARA